MTYKSDYLIDIQSTPPHPRHGSTDLATAKSEIMRLIMLSSKLYSENERLRRRIEQLEEAKSEAEAAKSVWAKHIVETMEPIKPIGA